MSMNEMEQILRQRDKEAQRIARLQEEERKAKERNAGRVEVYNKENSRLLEQLVQIFDALSVHKYFKQAEAVLQCMFDEVKVIPYIPLHYPEGISLTVTRAYILSLLRITEPIMGSVGEDVYDGDRYVGSRSTGKTEVVAHKTVAELAFALIKPETNQLEPINPPPIYIAYPFNAPIGETDESQSDIREQVKDGEILTFPSSSTPRWTFSETGIYKVDYIRRKTSHRKLSLLERLKSGKAEDIISADTTFSKIKTGWLRKRAVPFLSIVDPNTPFSTIFASNRSGFISAERRIERSVEDFVRAHYKK